MNITSVNNIPAKSNQSKIHLTERQLKYYAFMMEGKTKVEAKRLSGYDEDTSSEVVERSPALRNALRLAMDARGLTAEVLAEKIHKGIESKKTNYYAFNGIVTDEREVSDNETQHKYVRTALEVRGDLVKEDGAKLNLNVGIIEMPGRYKVDEKWNEDATK